MNHLTFEVICHLADDSSFDAHMSEYLQHLHSCPQCQAEVNFQRSIKKVTRKVGFVQPSAEFAKQVLESIGYGKKKKWYEGLLNNAGNILALTGTLLLLGYIYSQTGSENYQSGQLTNNIFSDTYRIIQNKFQQYIGLVSINDLYTKNGVFSNNIPLLTFLAIAILVLADWIIGRFVRHS